MEKFKTKTVYDQLMKLNNLDRHQAMLEVFEQNGPSTFSIECETVLPALAYFSWKESKSGYDYWAKIHQAISDGLYSFDKTVSTSCKDFEAALKLYVEEKFKDRFPDAGREEREKFITNVGANVIKFIDHRIRKYKFKDSKSDLDCALTQVIDRAIHEMQTTSESSENIDLYVLAFDRKQSVTPTSERMTEFILSDATIYCRSKDGVFYKGKIVEVNYGNNTATFLGKNTDTFLGKNALNSSIRLTFKLNNNFKTTITKDLPQIQNTESKGTISFVSGSIYVLKIRDTTEFYTFIKKTDDHYIFENSKKLLRFLLPEQITVI
ncbi:MAG: hypothetical protein IPO78_17175 [Saprospiraceae bacterium]|nr:hypothetical protein [Saprospiraceae bacterium]